MTDSRSFEALVIGGGVNGLAAAAYLALKKKRTLLVEARETLGGLCATADLGGGRLAPVAAHALYALDPRMTSELKLTHYGLAFAKRDASLVLLRKGGDRLVVTGNIRASARNIAVHSRADARAWSSYRHEMFTLGCSLRALWWGQAVNFVPNDAVQRIARTTTCAWLDSRFESDSLKSLLAFDASSLSPLDAGSALILAWRAAQEMCGLQAAVAFPTGGPATLVGALAGACKAAGAELRTGAAVVELVIDKGRVAAARLDSGEMITAPLVLSSLSRRKTLVELSGGAGLGLTDMRAMHEAASPVGAAKILLVLDKMPNTGGIADAVTSRFIVAERLESYVTAHSAARAGRLPDEPLMEVVFSAIADPPGGLMASVLVRPVPRIVVGGWNALKTTFAARIVAALNQCIPGLARHMVAIQVLTPDDLSARFGTEPDDLGVPRMLADWSSRVRTPISGLYLCGADAEPVPAVSGRAGRIAASLALRPVAAT